MELREIVLDNCVKLENAEKHHLMFQDIIISNLSKMQEDQTTLLAKLSQIDDRLKSIEGSASNMDDHISFINTVYNQFQRPFLGLINLVHTSTANIQPLIGNHQNPGSLSEDPL